MTTGRSATHLLLKGTSGLAPASTQCRRHYTAAINGKYMSLGGFSAQLVLLVRLIMYIGGYLLTAEVGNSKRIPSEEPAPPRRQGAAGVC
jgi:hypothetical protein